MPWIELIHADPTALPGDRVRAFVEEARTIMGEVLGTRPEQLRLSVHNAAAEGAPTGAPEGPR